MAKKAQPGIASKPVLRVSGACESKQVHQAALSAHIHAGQCAVVNLVHGIRALVEHGRNLLVGDVSQKQRHDCDLIGAKTEFLKQLVELIKDAALFFRQPKRSTDPVSVKVVVAFSVSVLFMPPRLSLAACVRD